MRGVNVRFADIVQRSIRCADGGSASGIWNGFMIPGKGFGRSGADERARGRDSFLPLIYIVVIYEFLNIQLREGATVNS